MFQTRLPLLPLVLDNVPPGLRQALAREGIPFCERRERLPDGVPTAGQVLVDVDRLRDGSADDPFAALLNHRSARAEWHVDGLTLGERIARVDKRAVRRAVLDRLRAMLERAGGIWLRLSAFPFPYRSALNFRIDYDEYDPGDFDALFRAIAGNEHATSHYVCAAAHASAGDAWARFQGLDVGSHGYWHHTYRTREENLRNIRRGIETMRAAGIEPRGFAAPHGRFHAELLRALVDLDITHSSEFGLAYDDLPFFPDGTDVLQIPVHPVCLGLFIEAARREGADRAAAVQTAINYFQQTVQAKYRAGEPVFLYGHPTGRLGRYPEVLRGVFETVSNFGAIWKTTLGELADWWRARAEVRLSVLRENEQYVVRADHLPPRYRLGIEYFRGGHVALVPLDRSVVSFSPDALGYENRSSRRAFQPVRVDRPEGLKARVRRLIDWERVTPVEEIGTRDWRNLAKRTLRQWRG
jgi:hypothetical protein